MTSRAGESTGPASTARRLRAAIARRSRVDVRALAALRVSLGALLLADLLLRARDLEVFYTDAGVLPRAMLAERFPAFATLSLHAISGAAWVQAALFVVAAVAALALLVGYRSRLATAASLVLLVSLHLRNPLVLNAGDGLLRRLLFWGLFLPLGGRWSVDALRDGRSEGTAAGLATAALLVQVLLVYLVNAVVKLRGDLWLRGDAVRYVFSLDQLTVLLGDVLAGQPLLLQIVAHAWLVLLFAAPLLLAATGRARAALVALFAAGHVGMALTLNLGLFPLVSVAALLPFLPAGVWDAAAARAEPLTRRPGLRERAAAVATTVPAGRSSLVPPAIASGVARLVPAVVACALALVLVWNGMALGYVDTPDAVSGTLDPTELRWDMFAPEPRGVDGWYVVPAALESGGEVDAYRRGPVTWDRPPDVAEAYPNQRWLVYLLDLRYRYPELRPGFAAYLCDRWNGGHEDDVVRLSVHYVEQPTRLEGPEPTRRVTLLEHTCGSGAVEART